ncbi:hypothetical protein RIF29_42447 [Crotalaria pallida]|uniref:C3H1-type domain-containing protein n=1 Tax=Crotalaria pallida TaxID=3830 RepID=A0AAN9HTN0_CROPI
MEGNDRLKPGVGFSSKEPYSGGRDSNKDDIVNEDCRVFDAAIGRDADGSHSMKMSPGLEEWKHKRHSQSPKNGRGRSARSSRSRSPACGRRWDSGVNDRNRTGAGGLTQPCRAFAAGNCRRGNHCHFLHHYNQNSVDRSESRHKQDGAPRYSAPHESGDYFLSSGTSNGACINFVKGRCTKGASCKYVHHTNSDEFGKISVAESTGEREIDRRHRENFFEQGSGHGVNPSRDTPCKFFAFGNCRNGNNCRFSHDRQACRSPNRRLRDDRSRSNLGGDQVLERPKLSDSIIHDGRLKYDRWGSDGNMADGVWDGPKPNDLVAVSHTANRVDNNKNGILGAPEPGFPAWPAGDGWDHSLGKNRQLGESPFSSDEKEANCLTSEKAGANIHSSKSGAGIWPGDEEMSPDWKYGAGTSRHLGQEHGQNKPQVYPGQVFNQIAQNQNASHSSSLHMFGQNQVEVSIVPPRVGTLEGMQNQNLSAEKKCTVGPNILDAIMSQAGSRNPPTQNMVSNEQLAQLTCLTASLAQILGTGQQLPQIYAPLNSHDAKDTSLLGRTEGSGKPVSTTFIQPDPAVGFQKQYDPVCDSIETKNTNAWEGPPGFSPIQKIAVGAAEIPSLLSNSVRQNVDVSNKSDNLVQLQQSENIEVDKDNNEVADEDMQISPRDNKITKDNGPPESTDQNGGRDEAKKKDVKGIRAFKYSLVEFVKELLKPTWKEGQITKEDYKAIVKKVTEKVTGTVQRLHIPQTQEKIDHYLSSSKPKLNKLVQAYVDKAQKA